MSLLFSRGYAPSTTGVQQLTEVTVTIEIDARLPNDAAAYPPGQTVAPQQLPGIGEFAAAQERNKEYQTDRTTLDWQRDGAKGGE